MSDYPGIDYGLGQSNIDKETGIHYGVISQRTPTPEAVDDVFNGPNTTDLNYESWKHNFLQDVREAVYGAVRDYTTDERANELADHLKDEAEGWDWLGDCYNGDEINPEYDDGDYKIAKCLDYDLFVLKSPYFTHAQFCSPCVPGAGNLDTPCETGPRTYCLGHDWFDGGVAPYPVFNVKTGLKVEPEVKP